MRDAFQRLSLCFNAKQEKELSEETGFHYSELSRLPYISVLDLYAQDAMHWASGEIRNFCLLSIPKNYTKKDISAEIRLRKNNKKNKSKEKPVLTIDPEGDYDEEEVISSFAFYKEKHWRMTGMQADLCNSKIYAACATAPRDTHVLRRNFLYYIRSATASELLSFALNFGMGAFKLTHMPAGQLECWTLLQRLLTLILYGDLSISKTSDEITNIGIEYFNSFKNIFGDAFIKPNTHQSVHWGLMSTKFGKAMDTWIFAFERENLILGLFPTNRKNVELQMMRSMVYRSMLPNLVYELLPKEHIVEVETIIQEITFQLRTSNLKAQSKLSGKRSVFDGGLLQFNRDIDKILSYSKNVSDLVIGNEELLIDFEDIKTEIVHYTIIHPGLSEWLSFHFDQCLPVEERVFFPPNSMNPISEVVHVFKRFKWFQDDFCSVKYNISGKGTYITCAFSECVDSNRRNREYKDFIYVGQVQLFFQYVQDFKDRFDGGNDYFFAYVKWFHNIEQNVDLPIEKRLEQGIKIKSTFFGDSWQNIIPLGKIIKRVILMPVNGNISLAIPLARRVYKV